MVDRGGDDPPDLGKAAAGREIEAEAAAVGKTDIGNDGVRRTMCAGECVAGIVEAAAGRDAI